MAMSINRTVLIFSIVVMGGMLFSYCNQSAKTDEDSDNILTDLFIADYRVAKEAVLREIPEEYIEKARTTLHIAYQHTSHGTQVARGIFGLPDYKEGDDLLFGITNNAPVSGKLDFHDYALASYAAP